jgi:hypothetical protein
VGASEIDQLTFDIAAGSAEFGMDVAAVDPSPLGEAVPERRYLRLGAGIVLEHKHPKAPRAVALLRPRRWRPEGEGGATEKGEEFTAFHRITSSAWSEDASAGRNCRGGGPAIHTGRLT